MISSCLLYHVAPIKKVIWIYCNHTNQYWCVSLGVSSKGAHPAWIRPTGDTSQWGLVGNISNSYWVSNTRKSPKKHKSPWFWIFTYVTEATLILSGSRNTAKMVPVVGGFKGCGREQCWWIWFGPSWCERYIKWKRVMCPCLRRTNSCRREKGEICLIQL